MSGLGILATALQGGAQAINQQAGMDVERQNRFDIAREMSKIQEEASMRLAENQARLHRQSNKDTLTDTRDFQADDATIAASTKVAAAKNASDRAGALATATDEPLNSAQREKAAADAKAAHDTQVQQTIGDAKNSELLAAAGKLKLADPEVAARIAASRAAASASAAHGGLLAQQTAGLKLDVKDKEKLNGLYDDASKILSDPSLSDEDRGKKFGDVQKQIVLMKSKNGQGAARDPELDTVTTKTKKTNPDGTEVETTEKSVRRPGGGASDDKSPYPDGTELKGKDGKLYVVKDGQPVPKEGAAEKPQARAVTAGTGMIAAADTRPAPDAIDTKIRNDLKPLAETFKTAEEMFRAAAKSNDPESIAYYQKPLVEAKQALEAAARNRLGNGADRFLSDVYAGR